MYSGQKPKPMDLECKAHHNLSVETISVTIIPRMENVSGTITPVAKIVSVYLGLESLQYMGLLYRGMISVSWPITVHIL